MLGVQLTMWMQAELDQVPGFGGSILYSPDDERFTLGDIRLATTEELANRNRVSGLERHVDFDNGCIPTGWRVDRQREDRT